jgi:beta-N-acetylhexosaminidase
VVLAEGRYSSEGETFLQELRKRVPKALAATLDPSMSRESMEQAVLKLPGCETYAVAAYSSAAAYRGTVGLSGDLPPFVQGLIASGKPVVFLAVGDPYLLRSFPDVASYLATFSTSRVSEVAAVRALLGEIAITGHLPVTIPGLAQYGEGIQTRATRAVAVTGEAQ